MSKNINKIMYINLNKRTDRKKIIENQLNNFDLDYERFEAIENSDFGIVGCSLSHLKVLQIAKERRYKNILILEDDFHFLVSKEDFEKQLSLFFNTKIEYNVCMLSYFLLDSQKTQYEFLLKVIEAQTASGYIVNENYYDKLIELYEFAIPKLIQTKEHWIYANDQIWKKYQSTDNWFCFTNRIGKQSDGFSDTSQRYENYNI